MKNVTSKIMIQFVHNLRYSGVREHGCEGGSDLHHEGEYHDEFPDPSFHESKR